MALGADCLDSDPSSALGSVALGSWGKPLGNMRDSIWREACSVGLYGANVRRSYEALVPEPGSLVHVYIGCFFSFQVILLSI